MEVKKANLVKAFSCDIKARIIDVAKLMADNRERHILVLKNNLPVGIISAVDIVNRVVAVNKDARKTTAEEIMVSPVLTVNSDENIVKAYMLMISRNIFSCPVLENGQLIGALTLQESLRYIKEKNNQQTPATLKKKGK